MKLKNYTSTCILCLLLSNIVLGFKTDSLLETDSVLLNQTAVRLVDSTMLNKELLFYNAQYGSRIYNLQAKYTDGYVPHFEYIGKKKIHYDKTDYFRTFESLNRIKPFTKLSFITGLTREEQMLSVFHYQNITSNLSIGAKYDRNFFQGIYSRQQFQRTYFRGQAIYKNKTHTLLTKLSYSYKESKQQQQGGLESIQDFENNAFSLKRSQPVLLNNSEQAYKGHVGKLETSYKFSDRFVMSDTMSLSSFYDNFYDGDPNSSLYKTTYYDTSNFSFTKESLEWNNILMMNCNLNNMSISFGGITDIHNYSQTNSFRNLWYVNAMGLKATTKGRLLNNKIEWNIGAESNVFGYRQGDFVLDARLNINLKRYGAVSFKAYHDKRRQSLFYQQYLGNHIRWNYLHPHSFSSSFSSNLNKESTNLFNINYTLKEKKIDIDMSYRNINNYTYFNTSALLTQYFKPINVLGFRIRKQFNWQSFYWDLDVTIQTSFQAEPLPLPTALTEQYWYYKHSFYNNAFTFRAGFRVLYNQNFYAYNYMPTTGQFYVQNERKIGNYPFMDIFVDARLRRVVFFVKYEHFNNLFFQKRYLVTPKQPFIEGFPSFGVSWNMLD